MANLTNISVALPAFLVVAAALWLIDRSLKTRERAVARTTSTTLNQRDRLALISRYAPIRQNESTAPRPACVPIGVGRAALRDVEQLRVRSYADQTALTQARSAA